MDAPGHLAPIHLGLAAESFEAPDVASGTVLFTGDTLIYADIHEIPVRFAPLGFRARSGGGRFIRACSLYGPRDYFEFGLEIG
jgi:hypothetical protein